MLMVGPPGAGKSMLAARLPTILPPLTPAELLEVSMIASVAGEIEGGALTNRRPFRAPHHSASMPALVGGGLGAARPHGSRQHPTCRPANAPPTHLFTDCSCPPQIFRYYARKQGQHGSARRDSGV